MRIWLAFLIMIVPMSATAGYWDILQYRVSSEGPKAVIVFHCKDLLKIDPAFDGEHDIIFKELNEEIVRCGGSHFDLYANKLIVVDDEKWALQALPATATEDQKQEYLKCHLDFLVNRALAVVEARYKLKCVREGDCSCLRASPQPASK